MKPLIETFEEQGFAILYSVLEPPVIEAVRRECAALVDELAAKLLAAGKISDTYQDEPLETRMIRLYANHPNETPTIFRPELHREGFFGLFAHPRLLGLAQEILGPKIRNTKYAIRSLKFIPITPCVQSSLRTSAPKSSGIRTPAIPHLTRIFCG